MRVVITGATGNVGTSLVTALTEEPQVESIVGIARREPGWRPPKTEWACADVRTDDLVPLLRGADAVVHLAWLFQPTHDPETTWWNNVGGSINVFGAAARAGARTLVYASSVGAYRPAAKDPPVDESWPTDGVPVAAYSREKAYVERVLDSFEREHEGVRVVRLRPGFIFKREAASAQRRLFAGPFLPNRLVRRRLVPVVPDLPGLVFPALHTADAAEAYRLALLRPVSGAFNIAAHPPVTAAVLAQLLDARAVRLPYRVVRAAVSASWHLHLAPAAPELLDLVLRLPLLDVRRAREELGWAPRYSAVDAVRELLQGLREGSGFDTPPLHPRAGGPLRLRELTSGVGQSSGAG